MAHIDKNGSRDLDNAIPVCFDCHFSIGSYADDHPRGKKFAVEELKKRRNQIYDEQTAALVPPIEYSLSQQNPTRELPDVGFHIGHLGGAHPVRAYIKIVIAVGNKDHLPPPTTGHYDGRYAWNLNPRQHVFGHFQLRPNWNGKRLRARIEVTIADIYDYRHALYPVGYILESGAPDWYAEPCEELM